MTATLHDVAAKSGVSIATASRAINGLPVSAASKAKVDRAVAALGYIPNTAARTLRSDKSAAIGMVFFNLRNALALDLIDSIGDSIEAAGYSLLIAAARGDADRYDLLMRRFLERRVDGLFCVAPRGASPALARYQAAGIPVFALFDRSGDFETLPLLTPAFAEPARALRDHLASLGHRRVALVKPDHPSPALAAVAAALRKDGMQVEEHATFAGGGLRDVLQAIMAQAPRATSVVAAHAQMRGLTAACEALGIHTPRDLSLVSISEIAASAWDQRAGVSALTVDPAFLGQAAGAAMLASLKGRASAKLTRVSAGTFDARRTTARPPSLASPHKAPA